MNAPDILENLNEQGVTVLLDGDNLRLRGSVNVLTPELTAELRRLKTDLIELLTPSRNGTELQQLAYDVRDARLIAECRARAVELQAWLTAHADEHLKTVPLGLPEWVGVMVEFNVIERGQLRNVFHYEGCIHGDKGCPQEAPVNCTACEGHDE